ncbi:MAG: bifunctional phosphopantothenoylcysteine decarboxylase/phosphopantothenate--cysteine ligase CoaBC [Anaerolineales bacterium]
MTTEAHSGSIVPLLESARILLGVTGSIAAYKAVELASSLTQAGADVDVLLSSSAARFVSPMTFRSVTGRRAYTDNDLWGQDSHILHVELGRSADLLVVAPATAHTIAKLAHGEADNLISLAALSCQAPIVIAPAMDGGMYQHPAVQANIETLRERSVHIVGPARGRMASGLVGEGRLLEPAELMGHVRLALGATGPLQSCRLVVTAGGTQEAIDPVRSITNRSSGKQGYALAQAAIDRGAQVVLISGPTALPTPVGVERVDVTSAEEMANAVNTALQTADGLLMAAAVADFRPKHAVKSKVKKEDGVPNIDLERTTDILAEVGAQRSKTGRPAILVGFAAETEDVEENARSKLQEKGLDLVVANDISRPDAGFDVDSNKVTIFDADGGIQELPLLSKAEVAELVLERVEDLLSATGLNS